MTREEWNKSKPIDRIEFVGSLINVLDILPIQYHNFDFIYQDFDNIPQVVLNWINQGINYNIQKEREYKLNNLLD